MDAEAEPVRVPVSKRLFLINSVSSVATRVLTIGAFAWVIQYLMKRIPDEELQLLPIVMAFALLLPLVQTVLNAGLARHITEAYARGDMRRVTQIVSSQFPLLAMAAVVVTLLGVGLAWNIDHILNIPPAYLGKMRFMLILVVGRLALGMCLVAFNSGLFAQQRFRLQNVIEIGGSLLRIVLMLWLILGVGPDIEWVIVAQVAAQVAMLLASTAVSVRLLPEQRFRRDQFSVEICKEVMSFGSWYTLAQLANLIRRAADAPILNLLSTPVAVNDFFLGSYVDSRIRDLTIVAGQPMLPALTAMHAHGQQKRLASAYLRGGRIALWASMAVAAPLIVFSYDLYSLYLGAQYSEHVSAATVLILLLLAFPLTYPTTMLSRICHATANMRPIASRTVWTQLFNLVLTVILVGGLKMGAVGSALSTLIAAAISSLFLLWPLAMRMLDLSWQRFIRETLVPGILPAVVAGGLGFAAARLAGDSALTRVLVGGPTCLLTYGIAVLFALRPADRADLGRIRENLAHRLT